MDTYPHAHMAQKSLKESVAHFVSAQTAGGVPKSPPPHKHSAVVFAAGIKCHLFQAAAAEAAVRCLGRF